MSSNVRLFTFANPQAMVINADLAMEIGFNESVIFLQLEFLIRNSTAEEREGKKWTYQSLAELKEKYFPWWSIMTIKRTIDNLVEKNLIFVGNFNKYKYDRTQWYSLNYEEIAHLKSVKIDGYVTSISQNDTAISQNDTRKEQNVTTIPETTTETTTEILDDDVESSNHVTGSRVTGSSKKAIPENIFTVYEREIGMITPMIAEALKDAEGKYPPDWIAEALRLAAMNNARSWSYANAILKRWKVDGFKADGRKNGKKPPSGKKPADNSALDELIRADYPDWKG